MNLPLSFVKTLQCAVSRRIVLIVLLILTLWFNSSTASEIIITDCGLPKCMVKCRCQNEPNMGCKAIKRALSFFKSRGYVINPSIRIEFIKGHVQNGDRNPAPKSCLSFYNRKTKCIKIYSWGNLLQLNQMAFGNFPYDPEYYTSIIAHEVAHCLFDSILESRGETTTHPYHEFVAYVTQIETMAEPQKTKVLSLWPKEKLPSVYAINFFNWMSNPKKFSVLSYRFFKAHPDVFQKILDGKIQPPELKFIRYF